MRLHLFTILYTIHMYVYNMWVIKVQIFYKLNIICFCIFCVSVFFTEALILPLCLKMLPRIPAKLQSIYLAALLQRRAPLIAFGEQKPRNGLSLLSILLSSSVVHLFSSEYQQVKWRLSSKI